MMGFDDTRRAKCAQTRMGFSRDEDGSLVIFGMFLFILMLLMSGMAVDLMRFETHRARLQSTLDRAVLAAASLSQPLDPGDVVIDYFDRAGLEDYIDPVDVVFTDEMTAREVSATAYMDVNSTFMRLLNVDKMTAPAAGTAIESASRTEVSLILDVSGSMGSTSSSGHSKIYDLREAATDFVNILQCNPENPNDTTNCTVEPDTVSITLVPYNEQVLAGETLLDNMNVTAEQTASSCITWDSSDFSTTTIDPTVQYKRTGHFDPWSGSNSTPSNWTCDIDNWRAIMPFENDPADLRTRISQLRSGGYTSIDVATKWGSGLLDPAMQPVIEALATDGLVATAFDDRPYGFNEIGVNKVIVLMTDGVNTTQHYLYENYRDGLSPVYRNTANNSAYSIYNASNGMYYWDHTNEWKDHPYGDGSYEVTTCTGGRRWWQRRCTTTTVNEEGESEQLTFPELWVRKTWSWYEKSEFGWLNNPGSSWGESTKNNRLDAICDAAKAQNITIFTIGFEVTQASGQVMEDCASSSAHYFDVDGTNLVDAFAAIARSITVLRLVN